MYKDTNNQITIQGIEHAYNKIHSLGFNVIPVNDRKAPTVKDYAWFFTNRQQVPPPFPKNAVGFAVLRGFANITWIDLDQKYAPNGVNLLEELKKVIGPLINQLTIQQTPSGGWHLVWRCDDVKKEKGVLSKNGKHPLAEVTNYIVLAPSPGYKIIQGDLSVIPYITPEAQEKIYQAASNLSPQQKEEKKVLPTTTKKAEKPAWRKWYNENNNTFFLLVDQCGFTEVERTATHVKVLRPGSTASSSGEIKLNEDVYFNWSTSLPFKENQNGNSIPNDAFEVYCRMLCDGDFRKAKEEVIKKWKEATTNQEEKQDYDEKSILQILEAKIKGIWDFRFNTIKLRPEWRKKGEIEFIPMDDYTLNSMSRKLQLAKVKGSGKNQIANIINSDFAPKIDPVCEYFNSLPNSNSEDEIQKLCDTVTPLVEPEMFRNFFEKWLVGAVANAFDKKMCRNHICFILTGQQGAYKSTWIRLLCPPALQDYYYEGNLDPENKDDLFATAENFIYNMDDYFADVTKKKINAFKSFLTKNSVKARASYGRYSEERPKICSFIASSNEDTFLHDPTGNRRFVPFEVSDIDIEAAKKINMDLVWSKAYQQYKSGFQYWIDREEQQLLSEYNSKFEVQTAEYEAVIRFYQTPDDIDNAESYQQNTELRKYLEDKTGIRMSARKIGEAMKKAGFDKIQRRINGKRTWIYPVDIKQDIDIEVEVRTVPKEGQ